MSVQITTDTDLAAASLQMHEQGVEHFNTLVHMQTTRLFFELKYKYALELSFLFYCETGEFLTRTSDDLCSEPLSRWIRKRRLRGVKQWGIHQPIKMKHKGKKKKTESHLSAILLNWDCLKFKWAPQLIPSRIAPTHFSGSLMYVSLGNSGGRDYMRGGGGTPRYLAVVISHVFNWTEEVCSGYSLERSRFDKMFSGCVNSPIKQPC